MGTGVIRAVPVTDSTRRRSPIPGHAVRGIGVSSGLNPSAASYSPAEQLNSLLETGHLDEDAVAAVFRGRGLFPHHLQPWRVTLTAPLGAEFQALLEAHQGGDRLARELLRKDKALAEAATLLVLQKSSRRWFLGEAS